MISTMDGGSPESGLVLRFAGLRVRRPGTAFAVEVPDLGLGGAGAAALLGPSGCGKTSVLLALLRPAPDLTVESEVEVGGEPMSAAGTAAWRRVLREHVALILQDARAALDPLRPLGQQLQQASGCSEDRVAAALAALGIERPADLTRRYPHQVSGGQAQRVCLAVADEPTAALDDQRLEDLVRRLELPPTTRRWCERSAPTCTCAATASRVDEAVAGPEAEDRQRRAGTGQPDDAYRSAQKTRAHKLPES